MDLERTPHGFMSPPRTPNYPRRYILFETLSAQCDVISRTHAAEKLAKFAICNQTTISCPRGVLIFPNEPWQLIFDYLVIFANRIFPMFSYFFLFIFERN